MRGEYKPPFFPTIFKIKGWDERKGVYLREIPIDSKGSHVPFELNAPDDYFDRDEFPGTLTVNPTDMLVRRKLSAGVLHLRFTPTEGAKTGDIHPIAVTVSRYNDEPLVQSFNVKYAVPTPSTPRTSGGKTPPRPPTLSDLGLPEHRLITREQWGDAWTAEDIVKIREMNGTGKTSDIKICINMDADDLRGYLTRNRVIEPKKRKTIEQVYEIGILLYSLVAYIELRTDYGDREEIPTDDITATAMKGIAKTMLDLQINEAMLKEFLGD